MNPNRQPGLDALKVLASQLVVLHHLSAYGPLSDALHAAHPALMGWLYDYARMAVQVFLVLGGYLAARSLRPAMTGHVAVLWRTVSQRYLRLVPPLLAALLLTLLAATVARPWLSGDFMPGTPTVQQLLAHALLLQSVLNIETLSAGVWYVAIDFQLYGLLALLLWLGQRGGQSWPALLLVGLLGASSLLLWNRFPGLDDWAPYFFGAYALGAAAQWTVQARQRGQHAQAIGWLLGMSALGTLALLLEPRPRIALALGVALWLGLQGAWPRRQHRNSEPVQSSRSVGPTSLHALATSSYGLFLVHFAVLLLGNAWWAAHTPPGKSSEQGLMALAVAGITWAGCVLAGWAFERWIERPLARWRPTS